MPRPTRIRFPGACYHIRFRVRQDSRLFAQKGHIEAFESLLVEALDRFQVTLHAYCWLPGAYHLLLKTQQPNLSQFMRFLNSAYSQFLANEGLQCLQHDRYQAWVIDAASYLPAVTHVIHQAAQACPGVPDWRQYRWSSARFYTGKATPPMWLHLHEQEAAGVSNEVTAFYQLQRRPPVLGDRAFRAWVAEQHNNHAMSVQTPSDSHAYLAKLVHTVAAHFQQLPSELMQLQRGRSNVPRNIVIYLARNHVHLPLESIAAFFGMRSHAAVCNILQSLAKKMRSDDSLTQVITQIQQHIDAESPA